MLMNCDKLIFNIVLLVFLTCGFALQLLLKPSFVEKAPWSVALEQGAVLLADGYNLRGKMGSLLQPSDLCCRVNSWMSSNSSEMRCIVVFDHGATNETYQHPLFPSIEVCFSGPSHSADERLIWLVSWVQQRLSRDVVLVSDDQVLRKRCQEKSSDSRLEKKKAKKRQGIVQNARKTRIYVLTSRFFADLLRIEQEKADTFNSEQEENKATDEVNHAGNAVTQKIVQKIVYFRRKLHYYESKAMDNRLRRKFKKEAEAKGEVVAGQLQALSLSLPNEQDFVEVGARLAVEKMERRNRGEEVGMEEIWERYVLAEQFRRELERLKTDKEDSMVMEE